MCEIGIVYFVLSCCMIKRIYVYLNVYIYITYTCMYIMKKSDIEQFKWPYPAMMTQCSTYQAPKNTHRNLKTGLLAEFLAQIWQIFSHVPSSPIDPLTDFSQIFSQVPSYLTDFSQILITDFSQISDRLLTAFFLPMAEGHLWEICDFAGVFEFLLDDSSNWVLLLVS